MGKIGRTHSKTGLEATHAQVLRNSAEAYRRFYEPVQTRENFLAVALRHHKAAGVAALVLVLVLIGCIVALWPPF
jgi:hypothetical protein